MSANLGQSPARQVQLHSGIPNTSDAITINKVCASGMKSIVYASQSIQLGLKDVVITGGFESMSNAPYYVQGIRFGGLKFGDAKLIDSVNRDGLSDAYDGSAMGNCSDNTARVHNISRQEQDNYATTSYKRAMESVKQGYFKDEMVGVPISGKKGEQAKIYLEDEEINKVNFEKMTTLRPAFSSDGSATAFNSSKLNDGASALILMSSQKAHLLGLKPLARIIGYADAATKPLDFPIAPSISIAKAVNAAGLKVEDIDYFEINEAFSSVALANMKLLNISHDKTNVLGGAVAMGHPLGSSGSRIVVTLAHLLKRTNKRLGVAAICNGGGGSTAVIIERL